jgi:hypothetical protein
MLDMCTGILVRRVDARGHAIDDPIASSASAGPTGSGVKDSEEINLRVKFREYISKEEGWLDKNLKDAGYDLDSVDSVRLVLGTGQRIEKVWMSPLQVKGLTRPAS